MRDYTIKLDHYGISRERVRELMWLCRQYDDLKCKAAAVRRGEPVNPPRKRRGSQAWRRPDPTGEAAARLADDRYARRVKAIEDSAKAASPELWRYILRNLCRGIPFAHLNVPANKSTFTEAKKRFFIELDGRL